MQTILEILPAHWASAIVNGDETGMDDADAAEFNAWIDWFQAECGTILTCDVFSDEPQFVRHHGAAHQGVLAAMCHQYAILTDISMEDAA
jgi:hypothetical protein